MLPKGLVTSTLALVQNNIVDFCVFSGALSSALLGHNYSSVSSGLCLSEIYQGALVCTTVTFIRYNNLCFELQHVLTFLGRHQIKNFLSRSKHALFFIPLGFLLLICLIYLEVVVWYIFYTFCTLL